MFYLAEFIEFANLIKHNEVWNLAKYVKLIFKVQQYVEESRRWSATVGCF